MKDIIDEVGRMENEHRHQTIVSRTFGFRRKFRKAILGTLLILCVVASMAVPVLTHSGVVLSAWASTPPTIDGTIDAAEWADAASSSYTTTGGVSGTFYVMNDAVNLYIAVRVTDSTLSTGTTGYDAVAVYFDNDHDGAGPEAGDDIIGWNGRQSEGFRDAFSDGTYDWPKDSDYGGTSDGSAHADHDYTYECNHFEIVHPLDTIDDDHDFSLTPGDTVGFALGLNVDGVPQGLWPSGDVSLWYDIVIARVPPLSAWATITPIIDGRRVRADPSAPGEWSDAAKVDFRFVSSHLGEVHNATLYVKNDYINLYLLLRVYCEDYDDNDVVIFHFDNDNDGVKERGDNVLSLRGDGLYYDQYIRDSNIDPDVGGTQDGLGGTTWVWPMGPSYPCYYFFEIAFPLNTLDDDHDFSLSIGETVGFNTELRELGATNAYWPSSLWHEMAEISIASPPTPPPPSSADLRIDGIEVTQAVQLPDNSLPLVRGKTTVVRVYVSIGPTWSIGGPIRVTVYLYARIAPFGENLGGLSESFDAPELLVRDLRTHTANFILPREWVRPAGFLTHSLRFKAFVKAVSPTQSETNYDNNWIEVEEGGTFRTTHDPTLYVVPINFGTRASPEMQSGAAIMDRVDYLEALYPVRHVRFVRLPWETIGENAPKNADRLNNRLTQIGHDHGLTDGGIHQIYGATPGNVFTKDWRDRKQWWGGMSDPIWADGHGIASCGTGLTTMAHEINHNLGPGYSWGRHTPHGCGASGPDPSWPYPNDDIQEYGVDTSQSPIVIVRYDTPDLMSYCRSVVYPFRWISPYRWENLLNRLDDPIVGVGITIQQAEESLMISGWVSQNGTGSLDPVFRLPGARISPSIPGNYSLLLKDSVGNTLLTHSFQAHTTNTEGVAPDPDYFTILLPHQNGTTQVLLTYQNATVLDEIGMSPNAPYVEVLSPNGGEVWDPSVQTIEWKGEDADGDPLAYRLYYSADSGDTWIPISPTITQTSHQIDASSIQGSETALIRVVASDGFNIGEDQTDTVFTVMYKLPTTRIRQPENGSQFDTDDVILLRGRGTDVDDIFLPQTAYNWTSDIDGYLGNGSILTTTLTAAVHQITLTVTDSQGNTANDTILITVLEIEITIVTPSKTVLGQGSSIPINVAVENQGSVTQTLNITAYANETIIQTQTVLNLTSGNYTTLVFFWNTTSFVKGNYNIGVTASLIECEVTVISESFIVVAMFGDVTGPDGWPDGKIDIRDLAAIAILFGVNYPDPRYNVNYDIIYDGKIDIKDIANAAIHYGEIDP